MATTIEGQGINPALNKPAAKTTFLTPLDKATATGTSSALGTDAAKGPAGGAPSGLALEASATASAGGLAEAAPPADGQLWNWGFVNLDLEVPDRPDIVMPSYGDIPVPPVPEPKPEPQIEPIKPEPAPEPPKQAAQGLTFKSWGDPHEVTGDGLKFDNQLVGDFVALRSKSGDFELQKRHEHVGGQSDGVTFNTEASLKTNGDVIHFDSQTNQLTINGQPANLANGQSVKLPGGATVTRNGGNYTINTAQGDTVTFIDQGQYMDIEGKMSASRKDGEVTGALGAMDADTSTANDLVLPNGDIAKDLASFLEAWRVGASGVSSEKLIPGYAAGSPEAPTAGSLAANRIMFDALSQVDQEAEKRRKEELLRALKASDAAAAVAKAQTNGSTAGSTAGSSGSPSPTPAPSPSPSPTPTATPAAPVGAGSTAK
ncbi:MAG: VWD domain-containing protein [Candidatus Sericytochromatia bacterium]|nr:VWD domain-containing protein [Candidatus Tanganyikabacteria bacterium]